MVAELSDMVNLDIEEIGREGELLIRSCRVKINGNTVITPTRTIGATLSDSFNVKESARFIGNKFRPFGEVYASISLNKLANILKSDEAIKRLNLDLSNRVNSLKEAGALPYILLSITNEGGDPLNCLLPPRAEKFVFNLLWGTQGNSIIVTPLLGTLTAEDHSKLIGALHKRQQDAIDRKNQPLMAIIPPSYSLIDQKLIEKCWNSGVRIFGYNCENTKYGAYGPIIESLHYELSRLSKENEEEYILNAINSKFKYGKQSSSRVNNLIGSGYGFDTHSPNHMRLKGFNRQSNPKQYIFDDSNYGFLDMAGLNDKIKNIDEIANTAALKGHNFADIPELSPYMQTKISKSHNIEKTIKEIEKYSEYIQNNELFAYLSEKEKIKKEIAEIERLRPHDSAEDEW